jgi:peptidoglycan/xylan/chitin deacetylase (PgdA/CDA1 family)
MSAFVDEVLAMSLLGRTRGLSGSLSGLLLVGALVGAVPAAPATAAGAVTVSLAFHDGLSSQYRNARPVLKAHGVNGTFYVASDWMRTFDAHYMRSYELDNLYRDGDEIGGMGRAHQDLTATYDTDPAADTAYKIDQVCGDKQVLSNLGYDPVSFSYPGGAVNPAAEQIVQGCGYTSGRLIGGLGAGGADAEPIPPADPFILRALSSPDPYTLSDLENAVTTAAGDNGGWIPVAIGNVCDQADTGSDYASCMSGGKAIDAGVLSQFLDWVQSPAAPAGTTVRTVRDVMGAAPQPPLPPRPTTVSLTFDDGDASQFPLGANLAAHQDKATFYINTGAVDRGEAASMSWAQIHQLADQGNEIGGHTLDHIDLTDPNTAFAYKWNQTCADRARLYQQGFNPVSFAYPFAAFNSTAESIVAGCGFQSGRTGGTLSENGPIYAESIPPRDPYGFWIEGTTYDGAITLQSLQDDVTAAMNHGGGWVPELFHEICYPNDPSFATCMGGYRVISAQVFEDFLAWLDTQAGNGVSVRTVGDVMNNGGTPPPVVVTSPKAASTVNSIPGTPTQATLSGTAASGGGDVTVKLYSGSYSQGAPAAILTATQTSGSWSVQTDGLADGTYTVQASQQAGGLTGTSPPVTFTIAPDKTAPTVTITTPAASARVGANPVTISGTGGTSTGDNANVRVEVRSAAAPTGADLSDQSVPVAADGTWTTPVTGLADGNYVVVASQGDAAGNTGTAGPRAFTVDGTAPVVTLTAPVDGVRLPAGAVTVAGTAGRATGDAATVRIQVWTAANQSGTPLVDKTATVGTTGTWTTTATGLAGGDYVVKATQTDSAGNTGSAGPRAFTIDNVKPVVTITTPATNTTRVGPGDVALAGSASIGVGDLANVHLVIRSSSSPTSPVLVDQTVPVAALGTWSTTASGLAEGSYTATVTQTDSVGNVGTANRTFIVDLTAPVETITSPVDGSSAYVGTVAVKGTGTRGTGDATTMTLEVHPGTDASAPATSTVNGNVTSTGAWSVNVTGLAAGDWTFVARQSDSAGNVGRSAPVHITLNPTMKVTGVSPSTIGRGATGRTVVLTGSNLPGNVTPTVSGTGVTVSSFSRDSDTQLTMVLAATATATTGNRNVVLASAGQPNVTCTGCLQVTAFPKVNSLTQKALAAGLSDQALTANGTGFTADTQLAISGAGVTSSITAGTATTLALNVSVAPDAPVGARDVVVTNADGGTSTCVGCFTVAAPPTITSVTPATVKRGAAAVTMTVTGTGFENTLKWTVDGTGVTLGAPTFVSPTTYTMTVRAASTATLTAHTLTGTSTATRGTASLLNAITVVP